MTGWTKVFHSKKKKKKMQMESSPKQTQQDTSGQSKDIPFQFLDNSLEKNIQTILNTTGNSVDITIRQFEISSEPPIKAAVVMTEGLIDNLLVNEFVIDVLLRDFKPITIEDINTVFDRLESRLLPISNVESIYDWNDFFQSLLTGEAIILIDGVPKALKTNTIGGEKRSISEPKTEVSLRGPRESFTESLRTNTALLRRRINNPNLWIESVIIGKVTKTEVNIVYIKGIANDKIVREVKRRLNKISVDDIKETGYIEQLIEDDPFSTFPTIYNTERPDVVAANLLEGRVAIFINGSPSVLTAPALFVEFFQSVDDYYFRFDISIFIRILRVLIFVISLIGPSTYVAITTFHQEMVPTLFITAIAAQREAVPFPAIIEALLMEITFEILREAGIRMPRAIGQAVSIVGALVIGQAAVQANIVSPAMVIVVSFTAIASFATPSIDMAISARIIRFMLMSLSAFMGFYGIVCGLMVMALHLCSLRSFGIPYMSPLAPAVFENLGDTVIRLPIWSIRNRPRMISQKNITRAKNETKPMPPADKNSRR